MYALGFRLTAIAQMSGCNFYYQLGWSLRFKDDVMQVGSKNISKLPFKKSSKFSIFIQKLKLLTTPTAIGCLFGCFFEIFKFVNFMHFWLSYEFNFISIADINLHSFYWYQHSTLEAIVFEGCYQQLQDRSNSENKISTIFQGDNSFQDNFFLDNYSPRQFFRTRISDVGCNSTWRHSQSVLRSWWTQV